MTIGVTGAESADNANIRDPRRCHGMHPASLVLQTAALRHRTGLLPQHLGHKARSRMK